MTGACRRDRNERRQEKMKAENEAQILAIRTLAEVQAIKDIASANAIKNTEQFIQLEAIKAWGSIEKVYFGESIPGIMFNPLQGNRLEIPTLGQNRKEINDSDGKCKNSENGLC